MEVSPYVRERDSRQYSKHKPEKISLPFRRSQK
jgi:hypothetical protein